MVKKQMKTKYFPEQEYFERVKNSSFFHKFKEDYFAQNWYAAFCNNDFQVDGEHEYSTSWRGSGGDVATIRGMHDIHEDYIDWYCSGMGTYSEILDKAINPETKYVPEGTITPEVEACLKEIGFVLIPEVKGDVS